MFINIGNCFWAQMNVEACVNPAEQGTSDNAAPGNPQQHEALHVGLPQFSNNCCFQVVNYPWFSVIHLVLDVPP
jgi:hypothetical protein